MATRLRDLQPEPFGSKVRRARLAADLTLDQAIELIAYLFPASRRSVARLEDLIEVPGDRDRRQMLAYYALLAYGVDPASVGMAGTQAEDVIEKKAVLARLARIIEARPLPARVHLLLGALLARLIPIPQSGIAETR